VDPRSTDPSWTVPHSTFFDMSVAPLCAACRTGLIVWRVSQVFLAVRQAAHGRHRVEGQARACAPWMQARLTRRTTASVESVLVKRWRYKRNKDIDQQAQEITKDRFGARAQWGGPGSRHPYATRSGQGEDCVRPDRRVPQR
jgi:hypothetical protein